MQFYMAPLEGITGYIYRNAYYKCYGDMDRYFTPFIMSKKLNQKEIKDILPENNQGMELIPQILTNRAEDFIAIADAVSGYGYKKINLNLGCPSPTVTSRNRGAGFLALTRELDRFLDEIFSSCPMKISIKTRIGLEDEEEWPLLLKIYEKYPVDELIIHPRLKTDQYKSGTIHKDAYELAVKSSSHSLCYNGDIDSAAACENLLQEFPQTEKIMIGRGILRKPWLISDIRNGQAEDQEQHKKKLKEFHEELLEGYVGYMSGDTNTLYKMKELWAYLGSSFTNPEKYMKKIRKAQKVSEYKIWVDKLFREQELIV